jgi:hypothetical protein
MDQITMPQKQRKPQKNPNPWNRGKGKTIQFLRDALARDSDECLTWPFCRDPANGYGRMGYLGKMWWTHRLMCVMAHGEPPTPDHEASHLCGNGHGGCVNPKHLEWKTASENHLDRRRHGTAVTSTNGPRPRIPKETKELIRSMRDRYTLVQLGALFDLPFQTISRIEKEDPNRPKKFRVFTDEEDAMIRSSLQVGKGLTDIAQHLGRSYGSVHSRARRLNMESHSR